VAVPKPLPTLSDADIARFWSKVDVREPDACWLWQASCFKEGYGQFKVRGRNLKTNRIAYFLGTGCDLGESLALHTCDNPSCCNPAHVYGGTAKDNIADAINRGRFACGVGETHGSRTHPESRARGERASTAKLTADQVTEMRGLYATGEWTQQSLADRYGLQRRSVCDILRGKNWAHIPADLEAFRQVSATNRSRRGDLHGTAKLSSEQVSEIRARYAAGGVSQKELAAAFGVTAINISKIVRRESWKHVA